MKHVFIFAILLLSMTSSFAQDDELSSLLHERIEQREPEVYTGASFEHVEFEVLKDENILGLINNEYEIMMAFATQQNLIEQGFSYTVDSNVYKVIKDNAINGYTFSIIIAKNSNNIYRRFFIVNKRVDGVFYVSRITHYEME